MKTYKTLLFDVDDTLLDFGAAEKSALRQLFAEQSLMLTPEVEEDYKRINRGLWRAFEEGSISRDEVVNTRFSLLFRKYGQEMDGVAMEKDYRRYLEQGHDLVRGSLQLLEELQNRYDLYVVTNGVSETQYKRLQASGLYSLFKAIFVSEDTGFQKPMKEFFEYVFVRIPDFSVEQGLIIGDTLNSDIKGGALVGLDTCWFNPNGLQNDTGIVPTYEIQDLEELKQILK